MATRSSLVASAALAAFLLAAVGCRDQGETAPRRATAQETIAQPSVRGLPVAPESERVDLAAPTFSDPTNVTNPLFPVSRQESVLLLGRVDGQPFRTEVTLLPETRIIAWQGQQVETLVSQYVAYLGGRIHEVAYDFYAQDDDGAVWYFGEDVFNFEDGVIADTHGTWLAGKDGPAAMIMPADPQVGDVYRPENIPGFVFEEVTVKAVGRTLDGPLGPVEGGLVIEELHMDGHDGGEDLRARLRRVLHRAAAATSRRSPWRCRPTRSPGRRRPSSSRWRAAAADAFAAAEAEDWDAAQAAVEEMAAAWETVQGRRGAGPARAAAEPGARGACERSRRP